MRESSFMNDGEACQKRNIHSIYPNQSRHGQKRMKLLTTYNWGSSQPGYDIARKYFRLPTVWFIRSGSWSHLRTFPKNFWGLARPVLPVLGDHRHHSRDRYFGKLEICVLIWREREEGSLTLVTVRYWRSKTFSLRLCAKWEEEALRCSK